MGYGIVVNGSIGSILIIVIKPVAVIIAFNDQFYQGDTVISNAWFSSSLILHPLGLVYRFSINVTVAFEFCYQCFEIWKSEFWCLKFFKCFFLWSHVVFLTTSTVSMTFKKTVLGIFTSLPFENHWKFWTLSIF